MEVEDNKQWVFSYGSNSTVQLRARVKSPELRAYPAKADGWERVFCMKGCVWGVGGVASVVRQPSACCYGAAVRLSPEELQRLDGYECPQYIHVDIDIDVILDPSVNVSTRCKALVYVNTTPEWRGPPSAAYITAIQLQLREQWASLCPEACVIDIYGLVQPVASDPETPLALVHFQSWSHPGVARLPLEALIVEANALRPAKDSWVMPRTMTEIVSKLAKVGVTSAAQFAVCLSSAQGMEDLNLQLEQADTLPFCISSLQIFTKLLGLEPCMDCVEG